MPNNANTPTPPTYDYPARLKRAQALLQSHNLDGLYLVAGPEMIYFTGYSAYQGGWPVWLSALLLPAQGEPALVISDMHYAIYQAKGGSWLTQVHTYMDGQNPAGVLGQALRQLGLAGGRIGVQDNMWYGDSELIRQAAPGSQVTSAGPLLARLRMVKDAQEIDNLRRANQISAAGFAQARQSIRAGRPEYEVALEIGKAMLEAGSGSFGVGGHFRDWSSRRFAVGDVVDVDIGGNYHGYGADNARMVFIGRPSAEVERMYRVTVEAFEATMAVIKPGVPAEVVHQTCYSYMARHGYTQSWKVGHGVGLGPAHEAPLVEDGNSLPLEAGMVFTVDPGCFISGGYKDLPVHIEDNVLVTETGAETLTPYTLEMVVV
ncbi:MAG: aminopeptidase P family protein [Anaerolineae bacterium]|nr:aminopeptidase P family protein [Anaerolineae bacterium]